MPLILVGVFFGETNYPEFEDITFPMLDQPEPVLVRHFVHNGLNNIREVRFQREAESGFYAYTVLGYRPISFTHRSLNRPTTETLPLLPGQDHTTEGMPWLSMDPESRSNLHSPTKASTYSCCG